MLGKKIKTYSYKIVQIDLSVCLSVSSHPAKVLGFQSMPSDICKIAFAMSGVIFFILLFRELYSVVFNISNHKYTYNSDYLYSLSIPSLPSHSVLFVKWLC